MQQQQQQRLPRQTPADPAAFLPLPTHLWVIDADDPVPTVGYQAVLSPIQGIHHTVDAATHKCGGYCCCCPRHLAWDRKQHACSNDQAQSTRVWTSLPTKWESNKATACLSLGANQPQHTCYKCLQLRKAWQQRSSCSAAEPPCWSGLGLFAQAVGSTAYHTIQVDCFSFYNTLRGQKLVSRLVFLILGL
jgi:hypothetical protein